MEQKWEGYVINVLDKLLLNLIAFCLCVVAFFILKFMEKFIDY